VPQPPAKALDNLDPTESWQRTSCFSTSVRRADRALTRIYDETLRPSGLSTTQYSLLSLLARAPRRMSITEIAGIQALDRTTLTRDLNPLMRDGLVEIAPADHDRRVRIVSLTTKGLDAIDIARPLWRAAQNRIAGEQGLAEMDQLLERLADLTARIR
jgi:DNA-binding MarR family transcriptional regulator